MAEIDLQGFEAGAIVERLANIKELIEKLDTTIASTHEKFVAKEEYNEFKVSRDREFMKLHNTVEKLTEAIAAEAKTRQQEYETWRARQETRKVPWTAVGSFVVAGIALLITFIQSVNI